jgi:hypothetical protein
MADLEFITSEEARERLLLVYGRSGDSTFIETLRRPFLNPIEQRNQAGRRKIHPLVIVGIVLLTIALISGVFFTLSE